jgi:hypothetical protein
MYILENKKRNQKILNRNYFPKVAIFSLDRTILFYSVRLTRSFTLLMNGWTSEHKSIESGIWKGFTTYALFACPGRQYSNDSGFIAFSYSLMIIQVIKNTRIMIIIRNAFILWLYYPSNKIYLLKNRLRFLSKPFIAESKELLPCDRNIRLIRFPVEFAINHTFWIIK